MSAHECTVARVDSWRGEKWADDIPSRVGWIVTCPTCGELSDGWAYAEQSRARGVATRHRRTREKGQQP